MMQLIFFTISVLVLLSGHALMWYIIIKLFHITTIQGRAATAIIIMFLFLSTIIASYLIHKWDNLFTRWYYIFAGFWIGLLVNFGIMTAIVLILKFAGGIFDFNVPLVWLKVIFFGGALVISLIGVYRAWCPKVTAYDVYIKDLPDSWNNKVVVQISDVHLGPVYREHFFSRLVNQINDLNPEAVFITGDLFDGMESDFHWLQHPFNNLKVPKGIYYSFGNHDLYLGFNRAVALLKDNPVKILDNKMETVDGLQIIGIDYSFNTDFDLEKAILKQVNYDQGKPSILLFHVPKNTDLAKAAGIDLQLSGHTHDGQLWPFNYVAKWAFRGYNYGLFTTGDFSLIVNGGAGSWGPPMRTAARSEIVKITLKKK